LDTADHRRCPGRPVGAPPRGCPRSLFHRHRGISSHGGPGISSHGTGVYHPMVARVYHPMVARVYHPMVARMYHPMVARVYHPMAPGCIIPWHPGVPSHGTRMYQDRRGGKRKQERAGTGACPYGTIIWRSTPIVTTVDPCDCRGMIIRRPGPILLPSAHRTGGVCSGKFRMGKWYRTLRATWFKPFGMKSQFITPESKLMHSPSCPTTSTASLSSPSSPSSPPSPPP
jgi:hypothetical protein